MMTRHGDLTVVQLPCLSDNYGFILRDDVTGTVAVIDTPDAEAIARALEDRGWGLDLILNTHWHPDHVGGNASLKQRFGATVIGPAAEGDKIPGRDKAVEDADVVDIGQHRAAVMAVPGHTMGHIAYHFSTAGVAFVGDTVFSLGCGRMFEGTPDVMWSSLRRLRDLPPETLLYCAHEYTAANARFARHVDPNNPALAARIDEVSALRMKGTPTVPMVLADERRTNPFLRADNAEFAAQLGWGGRPPHEVFGFLRREKDSFR